MPRDSAEATAPRRIAASSSTTAAEYAGWQSQMHAPSMQDEVQRALAFVAGHAIDAICAGRTDAGVHAVGQVMHFDTRRGDVAACLGPRREHPAAEIDRSAVGGRGRPGFHARHAAARRTYRYCILNRSARSALQHDRAARGSTGRSTPTPCMVPRSR